MAVWLFCHSISFVVDCGKRDTTAVPKHATFILCSEIFCSVLPLGANAFTMFHVSKSSCFSFSFDGSVMQLSQMISKHVSSKIHWLRHSGNLVVRVSKAAAIHFVFDALDMLEF
jgi:hypothetical protein